MNQKSSTRLDFGINDGNCRYETLRLGCQSSDYQSQPPVTGQTINLWSDPLLVALEQTLLVPSSTQVHLEQICWVIELRIIFDVLPGALTDPDGFTLNVQAVAGPVARLRLRSQAVVLPFPPEPAAPVMPWVLSRRAPMRWASTRLKARGEEEQATLQAELQCEPGLDLDQQGCLSA